MSGKSIIELYKISEISKKVAKKIDRTPLSLKDFDHKLLQVTPAELEDGRQGKIGGGQKPGVGGFTPTKTYRVARNPK